MFSQSSAIRIVRRLIFQASVVLTSIFIWTSSCFGYAISNLVFNSVAVDDFYVLEKNLLYIAHNDQNPESVATLVTGPVYGALVNNGQTIGYVPGAGAPSIYVDTFSYKWCELVNPPYDCSNVATVTILVIGNDDSQNYGDSCPIGRVGKPVNVTNGNMWLEQRDYSLPGVGEPIEINRFYNNKLYASGLFGYGWTTKYEYLTTYADARILKLTMPDGKSVFFGRPNTSTYFRAVSADLEGRIDQEVDGTYTLLFKDGRTHKFDSNGKLVWQRDRNGNQTNLTYNTGGVLIAVADPAGQTLALTPNANGKIQQISDSTGTIASYEYDPTGVYLKTVTYPDGSKYKFEYINKTVSGQVRTFLATVKDALDNVLETHAYDTQGRATTSEVDTGAEKYTLSFTSSYTTVVDGLGRSTKYYFDSQQKKKQVTRIEGACSCGSGGTETTQFVYDKNTLTLTSKTDALNNQTLYEYDPDRNVTKITDVLGIQKFTYNSLG